MQQAREDYAATALRHMTDTQLQAVCRRLGFVGVAEEKPREQLEAFWIATKGFGRAAYFADYYQRHRKLREPQWKVCPIDGRAFRAARSDQVYCSATCRQRAKRARSCH